MKIRSFKGPSLEKIYEAVHRELGTDAVVVNIRRPEGIKGLFPFMGGSNYELIAVVDDGAGDKHVISNAIDVESLRRASAMQVEKLDRMEKRFEELNTTLASEPPPPAREEVESASVASYAKGWDKRFLKMLDHMYPDFFVSLNLEEQRRAMAMMLPVEENFAVKREKRPHVVVLTGPTGSGKTTTLAKLAAKWSLESKLKIGMITTDTFRVAAVDQIKEYATLLGIELKVAFSAHEAAAAAKYFSGKDVVLVDTAGRSHHDQAGLMALRGILQEMGGLTVLMLLPATWDRTGVGELLGNFKILKPNYLVVTKLDETSNCDILTMVMSEAICPIAFLTNGQRVPQDIAKASSLDIAAMLVPAKERVN